MEQVTLSQVASFAGTRVNRSIGERFASGATSGFDYLRLSLSLLVMFWHSNGIVAAGDGDRNPQLQLFARIAVPLFFALSGFLVSSSLDRTGDLRRFLASRLLRVMPALIVVVVLSAMVLGPLFTTLDPRTYFAQPGFARYFLNLVGVVEYHLPGLFAAHEPSEVNRSLWTIPIEVQCYFALAVLFAVGGFRRASVLAAGTVLATIACFVAYRHYSYTTCPGVPGRLLMVYFLAGALVYRVRDRLPGGALVAVVMLAAGWAMLADVRLTLLSPLVLAYAAAAIGCTAPRRLPIVFNGDYSYGLYLYGMPTQQAVIAVLGAMPLWLHYPVSVAATGAVAALSWHFVEKPAMRLKSRFGSRVAAPTTNRAAPAAGWVPVGGLGTAS